GPGHLRAHPDRAPALEHDALGVGLGHEPSARVARVLEPGAGGRLLGAQPAAEVAEPAALVLGAAAHVAGHRSNAPPELRARLVEQAIAGPGARLLGGHSKPLADRVERALVLGALEHVA